MTPMKKSKSTSPVPTAPSGRIFLSFAQDDKHLVDILYRLLVKLTGNPGLVFKSNEAASGIAHGNDWRKAIIAELQAAKVFVGLATPNAVSGRWLWIEGGIVWARAPSCMRLLATPDLSASNLAPFDHLQILFLTPQERPRLRVALSGIAQTMGCTPQWDAATKQLLGRLIAAASAAAQQASARAAAANKASSALTPQARDERVLRTLLLHLPMPIFDSFVNDLHGRRIPEEIIYYFEGFQAELAASSLNIFDKVLLTHLEAFAKEWKLSLSFDDYTKDLPGGRKVRIMESHEFGDPKTWKSITRKFDQAANLVDTTYRTLVKYIKIAFPNIDLAEISDEAIAQQRRFFADIQDPRALVPKKSHSSAVAKAP